MSKKVGVIGSGVVGQVLAAGFRKHGYDVMIGSRHPAALQAWQGAAGEGVALGLTAETAAFADIVVLAVNGRAAEEAIAIAGIDNLAGKIVIDATNPIEAAPPVKGILQFFTGPNDSLMERLQKQAPAARFVKAWSSVGNAFMVNPAFAGGPPTMFICGDDDAAKTEVTAILDQFGWEAEDIGAVEGARAIEPLCQLWCAPGLQRGQWTHAFKLLKR
jgi:predicted dinucleotide-binding enzyme